MSGQMTPELCEWDVPNCPKPATLHVNWALGDSNRRERHLCEGHMAMLRERPCDAQEWPISFCDTRCTILMDKAARRAGSR